MNFFLNWKTGDVMVALAVRGCGSDNSTVGLMTNLYNGAMYIKDTDSCQGSYKDVQVNPRTRDAKRELDWRVKRQELVRSGVLAKELSPREWLDIDAKLAAAGVFPKTILVPLLPGYKPVSRNGSTPKHINIIKASRRGYRRKMDR